MSGERHDLGNVSLVGAEAIGEPGNRRFRLFARSPRGTAGLWMEREQFEALASALEQIFAQLGGGIVLRAEAQAEKPPTPHAPADFPDEPDVEFTVWQVQLGYDEDDDRILLRMMPLEVEERDGELVAREDVETVAEMTLTRGQAERLSTHVRNAIAGGRPRCPFCGRPMEEGHICEKQNGFHPVILN